MITEFSNHIDIQDFLALAFFMICWSGYSYYSRYQTKHENLITATNRYRLRWMKQMLKRDNRSVDAIMIGNLMRSITFSANTTIFILAGLIGMLSYHEQVGDILSDIPYSRAMTPVMWEIKIFLLILIFVYAFFKYTWSLRQHNYTSILIAAAPLDNELDKSAESHAKIAAFLAGNAAAHFNSGLRAYYFGLAALAWFIHPYLFIIATALVVFVTYKREFHSRTLRKLLTDYVKNDS